MARGDDMLKSDWIAAAAAVALLAAPTLASADCKLLQIAEFKLDPNSQAPIVDGSINGHPVRVLIDSGATFSGVSRHAAEQLGLPTVEMRACGPMASAATPSSTERTSIS
jgi:predicted aspartyl protease